MAEERAGDQARVATGAPPPDPGGRDVANAPRRRRWWQGVPFLLALGVLPVPFGLFFLAFIAMALLLSDTTRETQIRAGGAVLLFWWVYSFRQGDTSPYVAAPLLLVGGALFAIGALRQRRAGGRAAWVSLVVAVAAAVLAVVAFVPDGYRGATVGRDEAVRLTLRERAAHPWRRIGATVYLADRGRVRFVHTPVWYVALYEPNASVPHTIDGEPCYAQREVWRVDALRGTVMRATYDEATFGDDPCLPVRRGTGDDVRPLPAS